MIIVFNVLIIKHLGYVVSFWNNENFRYSKKRCLHLCDVNYLLPVITNKWELIRTRIN